MDIFATFAPMWPAVAAIAKSLALAALGGLLLSPAMFSAFALGAGDCCRDGAHLDMAQGIRIPIAAIAGGAALGGWLLWLSALACPPVGVLGFAGAAGAFAAALGPKWRGGRPFVGFSRPIRPQDIEEPESELVFIPWVLHLPDDAVAVGCVCAPAAGIAERISRLLPKRGLLPWGKRGALSLGVFMLAPFDVAHFERAKPLPLSEDGSWMWSRGGDAWLFQDLEQGEPGWRLGTGAGGAAPSRERAEEAAREALARAGFSVVADPEGAEQAGGGAMGLLVGHEDLVRGPRVAGAARAWAQRQALGREVPDAAKKEAAPARRL